MHDRTAPSSTTSRPPTMAALFEAQAARTPDAIAVAEDAAAVTYRELDARANQLARLLRAHGASAEAIVGLALERSIDLVVALIAVVKAGAAYLPLDPSYPPARLAFMLADAAPSLLLARHGASWPSGAYVRLDLDEPATRRQIAARTRRALAPRGRPEQAAYVIYTSGSTGMPSAVVGLSGGMINRLAWVAELQAYGAGSRVLARSSLNFIDGSTELLGALVHGASVVLAPPATTRDVEALAAYVVREQIEALTLVPSLLAALLDLPSAERLGRCRAWISSGERLSAELAAACRARWPAARLWNLYGASEASGDSLWTECPPHGPIPIGRPIARTHVHQCGLRAAPAADGPPRELFIGGAGVARGYLRQPALTAARFLPDPLGAPGARMYRTGDLAEPRADGQWLYHGRADREVKVRGHRVALEEVEAALRQDDRVAQAIVTASEAAPGDIRLIAGIVSADGAVADGASIRAALADRLPVFMRPSIVVVLPFLPLTPNGKVDRQAVARLAAQTMPAGPIDASASLPMTNEAAIVCAVMARLLGVAPVGLDDDFFAIGGHSILAARLAGCLRREHGLDVDIADVIEHPTARRLVQAIARRAGGLEDAAPPRRLVRPAVPADRHAVNRLCARTSQHYARGEQYEATHVVPLLWSEPFLMVAGCDGIVVEEQGQVIGYVVGAFDPPAVADALARYVRRRLPRVLAAYAGMVLRRRERWPREKHRRFLRLLLGAWGIGPGVHQARAMFRHLFADEPIDDRWHACCHVQVEPAVRGSGVGILLLRAWAEAGRARGARGVVLDADTFQAGDASGARETSAALLAELGFRHLRESWWILTFRPEEQAYGVPPS